VKISRVVPQEGFQYLLVADLALVGADQLRFDGTPVERWDPPDVYSYEPKLKEGDFWGFHMIDATWATTPDATEKCRLFLSLAGQLLPLPFKGREFSLLNVTECVNCLDSGRTEWVYGKTTGKPIGIAKYAFHADRMPESSSFKIPETARAEILCYEGLRDSADEFKGFVEAIEMTGLEFEEIWRTD
jgi:hypothetical protein